MDPQSLLVGLAIGVAVVFGLVYVGWAIRGSISDLQIADLKEDLAERDAELAEARAQQISGQSANETMLEAERIAGRAPTGRAGVRLLFGAGIEGPTPAPDREACGPDAGDPPPRGDVGLRGEGCDHAGL